MWLSSIRLSDKDHKDDQAPRSRRYIRPLNCNQVTLFLAVLPMWCLVNGKRKTEANFSGRLSAPYVAKSVVLRPACLNTKYRRARFTLTVRREVLSWTRARGLGDMKGKLSASPLQNKTVDGIHFVTGRCSSQCTKL